MVRTILCEKSISTKKYVITGGSCCGKTTLIEGLKNKGYCILPETARQIIDKEKRNSGSLLPWKDRLSFQKAIIELQKKQEENISDSATIFLDRGMLDNLAYFRLDGIKPSKELYEIFNKFNNYKAIFLLEAIPNYVKIVRKEDEKTAKKIHSLLNKVYREFGNRVIEVPYYPDSQEKRVEFVLNCIIKEKI